MPVSTSSDGRHPARSWLKWIVATLAALALLLAGTAWLALRTEAGARLLWQAASRFAPGQLSGQLTGGTLYDGITLRNVVYRSDSMLVKIDRLESDWRMLRAPLTLVVHFLHIGSAEVTLFPTQKQPRTLPQQFTIPLAIDLQSATVRQLLIHQDAATARYADIRLQAQSDRVRHTFDLVHATTPYGLATATLRLDGKRPFELAGTARLSGEYNAIPYRLDTRLSGTLQALGIQLDAIGKNLDGHAEIDATPFAAVPLRRAQVTLRSLDPRAFNAKWPHADLDIRASLVPAGDTAGDKAGELQLTVTGPLSVTNHAQAGALDQGLLPLVSAHAGVTLDARTQQLSQLTLKLPGSAIITGSGELHSTGQGQLTLHAGSLDLHALDTRLKPSQLSGPLAVRFTGDNQNVDLKLAGPSMSVAAKADLTPQRITLQTAHLQADATQLTLSGTLARDAQAAYSAKGKLRDFNPADFFASAPRFKIRNAHINADFDSEGALQAPMRTRVHFDVHDSSYDNLPMTGGGTVQMAGKQLLPSDARLAIAGNTLRLKGSFGAPSDRATLAIDAPALGRLGFGLSGLLRVDGELGGTLARPILDARYRADNLAFGTYRLASLSGAAHLQGVPGAAPDARLALDLNASGARSGDVTINSLTAGIDGSYANHTIHIAAAGRVRGQALDVTLAAQGALRDQPQGMAWDGTLRTLENRSAPRLSLSSPLPIALAPGRVELGAGHLMLAQASIDLQSFRYDAGRLRSAGAISALDIGRLLALHQQFTGSTVPFETDLVLDGRWNFTLAERADGFVEISRRSGDLRLRGEIALGLRALSLHADLAANRIALDAQASAQRIGNAHAQGNIGLLREDGRLTLAARSPLSGRITVSIPRLQTIAAMAGPRIALDGSVDAAVTVDGTLGDPRLSGTVTGERLALMLYDQGVRLRDGSARLRLDNNIVQLQQLEFHGGSGTLRATGSVPLARAAGGLRATIVADNLQLLANPSMQMTLSGRAEAATVDGQPVVTGKFVVDRALFSLPEKSPPSLGSDVVVIRDSKVQTAAKNAALERAGPLAPRIDIQVGLGQHFNFEGAGADLRLAGTLKLHSEPGAAPQAIGTVSVVDGSYEAFGTRLAIEHGVINFQGPLREPNVNILAMRREQEVAAGVHISGNVQRPRVQLVSEPDLPQEQKLSWLVFGRAGGDAEQGQAQAAVKGAAFGLLNKFGSGRIAQTFGLDTLAIGKSEFGLSGTQVVNLGKEISDRLSIGYEQSLAGAESVVKLTYELTRYWSVVLRGGTVTGLDMYYNRRFDRLR